VIDLQLQKETLVIDLQLQKETLASDLQLQKETLVIDLQLQKETLVIDLQLQKETLVIDLQLQKETLVIDLQLQKDHLATFEITLCYRGANIIWSKQRGFDSKHPQHIFHFRDHDFLPCSNGSRWENCNLFCERREK
jgi:hypothetical protein